MPPRRPTWPARALAVAAAVLVLKVTAAVVSNYGDYVPPDFRSDFLRGRGSTFAGPYRWAFYTHIVSGPVTLVVGLALVADAARGRVSRWHRVVGRVQVGTVLLLVAPSGLWMARFAAAGPVGAVGLATLAVATAVCAARGLLAARGRRFAAHRRWMWRCYVLLASAVVLRLIGGLGSLAAPVPDWFDPLATWACWVVPLAAFEVFERGRATPARAAG